MKATGGVFFRFTASSMACIALAACTGGGSEPQKLSAVQQCGQLPNLGHGPAFFCGTNQANLNTGNFQDGSHGYCMYTDENLSTVGYSAVTNAGGASTVMTQSEASSLCSSLSRNAFPNNCTTYIQCVRICAAGVSNCTN